MYRNVTSSLKTLGFLTVTAMALVSPLEGQRSGPEIWGANCGPLPPHPADQSLRRQGLGRHRPTHGDHRTADVR